MMETAECQFQDSQFAASIQNYEHTSVQFKRLTSGSDFAERQQAQE
jgi:hypothetical protein